MDGYVDTGGFFRVWREPCRCAYLTAYSTPTTVPVPVPGLSQIVINPANNPVLTRGVSGGASAPCVCLPMQQPLQSIA